MHRRLPCQPRLIHTPAIPTRAHRENPCAPETPLPTSPHHTVFPASNITVQGNAAIAVVTRVMETVQRHDTAPRHLGMGGALCSCYKRKEYFGAQSHGERHGEPSSFQRQRHGEHPRISGSQWRLRIVDKVAPLRRMRSKLRLLPRSHWRSLGARGNVV